jgi:D-threo-aldose 1-dehydrogenase
VLTQLRDQGVINTWGLGQNTVEPHDPALNMAEARPARFLLACCHTLLDREIALRRLTVTRSRGSSG